MCLQKRIFLGGFLFPSRLCGINDADSAIPESPDVKADEKRLAALSEADIKQVAQRLLERYGRKVLKMSEGSGKTEAEIDLEKWETEYANRLAYIKADLASGRVGDNPHQVAGYNRQIHDLEIKLEDVRTRLALAREITRKGRNTALAAFEKTLEGNISYYRGKIGEKEEAVRQEGGKQIGATPEVIKQTSAAIAKLRKEQEILQGRLVEAEKTLKGFQGANEEGKIAFMVGAEQIPNLLYALGRKNVGKTMPPAAPAAPPVATAGPAAASEAPSPQAAAAPAAPAPAPAAKAAERLPPRKRDVLADALKSAKADVALPEGFAKDKVATVKTKGGKLRLRKDDGTILDRYVTGTTVRVVGEKAKKANNILFVQVETGEGDEKKTGWMAAKYLEVQSAPAPAAPAAVVDAGAPAPAPPAAPSAKVQNRPVINGMIIEAIATNKSNNTLRYRLNPQAIMAAEHFSFKLGESMAILTENPTGNVQRVLIKTSDSKLLTAYVEVTALTEALASGSFTVLDAPKKMKAALVAWPTQNSAKA